MPFFVVADRPAVRIFNRTGSAREALDLAGQRRVAGAEAVFVYDGGWTLIEAPELNAAALRESAPPTEGTTFTVGGGATDGTSPRAQGRVRVFRGRRTDGRSGA